MRKKRLLTWLPAFIMAAAVLTASLCWLDIRYQTNDDAGILRYYMGFDGPVASGFNLFVHGLLAYPLYWLSNAFEGVAWFSLLQLALLGLSLTVLAKSIMQAFVNHNRPLWAGAITALAFLITLCLEPCARITFTQTAAMLGAAAVAQLLSIDHQRASDGEVFRGILAALCWAALGYALRQDTLWPILGFCGLAFAYALAQRRRLPNRGLKPMLAGLLAVAVAMGGMVGWRAWELAHSGEDEFIAWHQARYELMDYYSVKELSEEALQELGWTESVRNMADKFCFLDPAISTESFVAARQVLEAQQPKVSAVSATIGALSLLVQKNGLFLLTMAGAVLLWLVCLIAACLRRERHGLTIAFLALLMGLSLALLIYLGAQGRLPVRALHLLLLPFAVSVCMLLPQVCEKTRQLTAICVLLAVLSGGYLVYEVPKLLPNEEAILEIGDPSATLDNYALYEPDMLFIYDFTLAIDTRLFPDVSEGIPANITFWGGWNMRSSASIDLFQRYDIDLLNFQPEDLLRDNVCVASGVIDPPPMLLLNWLRETVNPDVDYTLYGEDGGVYFFQFYEP